MGWMGLPAGISSFVRSSITNYGTELTLLQCLELVGYQFERVFYKNNFASAVTIFSIYMTYGGTNWGNLGHPGKRMPTKHRRAEH